MKRSALFVVGCLILSLTAGCSKTTGTAKTEQASETTSSESTAAETTTAETTVEVTEPDEPEETSAEAETPAPKLTVLKLATQTLDSPSPKAEDEEFTWNLEWDGHDGHMDIDYVYNIDPDVVEDEFASLVQNKGMHDTLEGKSINMDEDPKTVLYYSQIENEAGELVYDEIYLTIQYENECIYMYAQGEEQIKAFLQIVKALDIELS